MKLLKAAGYALTTLMMYHGIPLAGWGLTDLAGFFASAPRGAYALIVLLLALAIGWHSFETPEGFQGSSGSEDALIPRQRLIKNIIIVMLFAFL